MATKTFNGVKANIAFDTRVTEKADLISGENISTSLAKIDKWLKAFDSDIQSHTKDKGNPHAVTKAQVGLGSVDNTSDLDKPISTDTQAALDEKASISHTHVHFTDKGNPHAVTKAQVGLSNVNNTSDLDKPISTDTQAALNGKAASSHNHSASNITSGTLPVARGGTGATTFTSGAALIGNGTGAVATRAITSSEASGSSSLITAGGVYTAIRKRVYTTLFTGSTPTSDTSSVTLNTENWGFYSMLRVTATIQWQTATKIVFWIPSAQLSASTNSVAMYTLCLANSSSQYTFTINAQKTDASTIQFSGAYMSITNIVGVR